MQDLTQIERHHSRRATLHGEDGLSPALRAAAHGRDWQVGLSKASDQTAPCPAELTDRECAILQMLSRGFSNKEAAKMLGISPETVKSHVKNIFQKLAVDRRAQAVSRGLGLGVISAC